jgi:hypothetical protein
VGDPGTPAPQGHHAGPPADVDQTAAHRRNPGADPGWRPLAGRAHLLRAVADRLRPVPPLATRRHLASDPDRGLQARADAAGLLSCDVSVDTTIARAQQHGAGATDVLWTPLRPHGRVPCSSVHGNKVAGKGESMRLRLLAWGAVLGLLGALLTPMAAVAQAETTTTHFSDTLSVPAVNPCTGVTGTVTTAFKSASTGTPRSATAGPRIGSPTRSGPPTAARQGCVRWWSSRSPTWRMPGRCAAGAGCCTGSGTGPSGRWSARAAGCTGSPHEAQQEHLNELQVAAAGRTRGSLRPAAAAPRGRRSGHLAASESSA